MTAAGAGPDSTEAILSDRPRVTAARATWECTLAAVSPRPSEMETFSWCDVNWAHAITRIMVLVPSPVVAVAAVALGHVHRVVADHVADGATERVSNELTTLHRA